VLYITQYGAVAILSDI